MLTEELPFRSSVVELKRDPSILRIDDDVFERSRGVLAVEEAGGKENVASAVADWEKERGHSLTFQDEAARDEIH